MFRIRGEQVSVLVVANGQLVDDITNILNFNMELEAEILVAQYLNQRNKQKDDIFHGVKFDFEYHGAKSTFLRLLMTIKRRQQRIEPDTVINVSGIFTFPDATVPVVIPDAKFGGTPINVGSRTDYVKFKMSGEADDFDIQI